MKWTYTRLDEVEGEIKSYLDHLLTPESQPRNDDEVKAFDYTDIACQELIVKLHRYDNFGPDPRDELRNALKIGIQTPDMFFLHHKGLYVLFYRDLNTTSAVGMGFIQVERKLRSYITAFFRR